MVAKESNIDVLIIGAGPAGLMAANWMARAGISTRFIDKRGDKVFAGQADGLECRTLEVFQSFGYGVKAWDQAHHMQEVCFWDPDASGKLFRSARIPDTVKGISRYQQCVLHQGLIESWIYDNIASASNGTLKLERSKLPLSINIDQSQVEDADAYPVSVLVKTLPEEDSLPDQFGGKVANGLFRAFEGDQDKYYKAAKSDEDNSLELIHAKYVIGCDGAHSWVRKELGIEMVGESTDYVWGVLDAVPITDFPDIRHRCAIHSANNGSIMVIPREHGLVRFYIQLQETPRDPGTKSDSELGSKEARASEKGRIDRSRITPEFILDAARKIFAPYTLDVTDIKWYTAYQIGQRVSPIWHRQNRVFIAGDACHTHSPKAGQGMNTSLMDTYNLGWKVAHVVKGLAKRDILATYEGERLKNAQDLIDFDHKLSRLFSGKPATADSKDGVSLEEFRKVFEMGKAFASGCIIDYEPSQIELKPKELVGSDGLCINPLANTVVIGRRLDSGKVVSQSEATPYYINDRMPSDGRWRILNFAGDFKGDDALTSKLAELGAYLDSPQSFIKKYTPIGARIDSVIEVLTVHASKRIDVEWDEFPAAFRPTDSQRRVDYFKIFTDDEPHHEPHGHIYKKYGIDPKVGALIVVRPDGYVSYVTKLGVEGMEEIGKFFSGFMIPQDGKPAEKVEQREYYGVPETFQPVLAI